MVISVLVVYDQNFVLIQRLKNTCSYSQKLIYLKVLTSSLPQVLFH